MVVDFPSPAGVGVIAVTSTSAPSGWSRRRAMAGQPTLALWRPYGSSSAGVSPTAAPISWIGLSVTVRAISRSCLPMSAQAFLCG